MTKNSELDVQFHMSNHYRCNNVPKPNCSPCSPLPPNCAPCSCSCRSRCSKSKEYDEIRPAMKPLNRTITVSKKFPLAGLKDKGTQPDDGAGARSGGAGARSGGAGGAGSSGYDGTDQDYIRFLLRLTEDVLRSNDFDEAAMQKIFDGHFNANTGALDAARMQAQFDHLKAEIACQRTCKTRDEHCLEWNEARGQFARRRCPAPRAKCACLNPNCRAKTTTGVNTDGQGQELFVQCIGYQPGEGASASGSDLADRTTSRELTKSRERFKSREVVRDGEQVVREVSEEREVVTERETTSNAPLALSGVSSFVGDFSEKQRSVSIAINERDFSKSDESSEPGRILTKTSSDAIDCTLKPIGSVSHAPVSTLESKILAKKFKENQDYVVVAGPVYLPKEMLNEHIYVQDTFHGLNINASAEIYKEALDDKLAQSISEFDELPTDHKSKLQFNEEGKRVTCWCTDGESNLPTRLDIDDTNANETDLVVQTGPEIVRRSIAETKSTIAEPELATSLEVLEAKGAPSGHCNRAACPKETVALTSTIAEPELATSLEVLQAKGPPSGHCNRAACPKETVAITAVVDISHPGDQGGAWSRIATFEIEMNELAKKQNEIDLELGKYETDVDASTLGEAGYHYLSVDKETSVEQMDEREMTNRAMVGGEAENKNDNENADANIEPDSALQSTKLESSGSDVQPTAIPLIDVNPSDQSAFNRAKSTSFQIENTATSLSVELDESSLTSSVDAEITNRLDQFLEKEHQRQTSQQAEQEMNQIQSSSGSEMTKPVMIDEGDSLRDMNDSEMRMLRKLDEKPEKVDEDEEGVDQIKKEMTQFRDIEEDANRFDLSEVSPQAQEEPTTSKSGEQARTIISDDACFNCCMKGNKNKKA